MWNETQLKEKLQILEQNEFRLSEQDDLSEILPAMLQYIGSTDSILRDDLIYSAFRTWMYDCPIVSQEQMRNMLPIVLDRQHLLYGAGEQDTDSVFTRAFSVLVLPLVLIAHRAQPFLSVMEIDQIKKTLLDYARNEKDRRGFVPGKGWAHATAHTADALDDLAQCPEMDKADLAEILDVIYSMVCVAETGYIHLEDERIVTAVIAVLKRQLLSDAEITQWIQGFAERALQVTIAPERLVLCANVKNFLQSLYFRLQWEQVPNKFEIDIEQALRRINPVKKPD
jgi:hypothetical protein